MEIGGEQLPKRITHELFPNECKCAQFWPISLCSHNKTSTTAATVALLKEIMQIQPFFLVCLFWTPTGLPAKTLSIAEFPAHTLQQAREMHNIVVRCVAFWPAARALIAQWSSRRPSQDGPVAFFKNSYNRTPGKKGDCAMFWSHRPRGVYIKGGRARALTQSAGARASIFDCQSGQ